MGGMSCRCVAGYHGNTVGFNTQLTMGNEVYHVKRANSTGKKVVNANPLDFVAPYFQSGLCSVGSSNIV